MNQPLTPSRILARRRARIAFGATLVVGVALVFALSAVVGAQLDAWIGVVFVAVWAAALAVYGVARLLPVGARALGAGPTTPVSAGGPTEAVHARRLGVASVAAPLAGIAAMMPLTLHALFSLVVIQELDGFYEWVLLSAVLTTHVHVFFALHGLRFARKLEAGEATRFASRGAAGVGFAATLACIPGAILFLVPPLIVLVTGMVFAPASYSLLGRSFDRERAALA